MVQSESWNPHHPHQTLWCCLFCTSKLINCISESLVKFMSPFQHISFRYAYQTQFQIYSANATKHKHIAKTQSSIARAEKQHKRYHQLTYEKKNIFPSKFCTQNHKTNQFTRNHQITKAKIKILHTWWNQPTFNLHSIWT